MSKKRKRDGTEIDVDLVTIYDNLAHESEQVRLRAARQLLNKTFHSSDTEVNEDQIRTILRRLFRGLCSSRKAARLGFVVALTEFLSQIQASSFQSSFLPSQVIDALETATEPEGGSRGQEERDYYFGRVFGAGAVVQSKILFSGEDRTEWKRLLNLLCIIATKKPWLRQECGWTLCQFVSEAVEDAATLQPFVEDIIDVLNTHKLIRTPEGVAIWLTARKAFPHASLSKHVWKYSHPLAAKDVHNLAEVMKNARTQQSEDEFGAQGSTSWSASLHFVWTVVLNLFYERSTNGTAANGSSKPKAGHETVSFSEFWKVVVDEGLLAAGSSNERKLWGVLLLSQVVATAPLTMIPDTLCPNTVHIIISAFSADARYLHKSAQASLQQFEKRVRTREWAAGKTVSGDCLSAILQATGVVDFDTLTKSKVISSLLEHGDSKHVLAVLREFQVPAQAETGKLKFLINLEYKLLASCIRRLNSPEAEDDEAESTLIIEILDSGLQRASEAPEEVQQYVKERNAAALEHLAKAGTHGQTIFTKVLNIQNLQANISDDAIKDVLKTATKRLRKIEKASSKQARQSQEQSSGTKTHKPSLLEGYRLLYSLIAFDIYNGEQESVEMMQDLLEVPIPEAKSEDVSTDSLVEILLSFSSRPSKLLRTLTPIVFESIASGIAAEGIESLTRVLATKENAQGQQEMFDAADEMDVDSPDEDEDEDKDSSADLDSDVELVDTEDASANDSDDASSSNSDSDNESDDDSIEDNDKEADELAAFNAALAAALGTSAKPDADDDNDASDSDSDMSDSEMLALDAKLSEVFRARKAAQSSSTKKQQQKDAKSNIINFKNRVLDLIEVYVKHQNQNIYVVDLILPLLQTIRMTQAKQIAERSQRVLKDLSGRCKGQNVPLLDGSQHDLEGLVKLLQEVHDEACMEASNNHAVAASQASILLVKILTKSGGKVALENAINMYAETNRRMLTDTKCKVLPGFFTDWNNWCVTARAWTTKL